VEHVERVRVGRFGSRAEAQVARAMLSEHGIEATIVVDDVAGLHPELSLATGGLSLEVLPDDAEEARELLADVPREERGRASARPRLRRRLVAWLMLALAVLLAVAVVTAIAEVGLHWL
jgi:hypothetical protein